MSTLSKLQRPRASSKTTKKNNIIICLEITPRKIRKPHPTPRRENPCRKKKKMHSLHRFTGNSAKNLQKPCSQRKIPHPEISRNPRNSRIGKKAVNQFATQINWLVFGIFQNRLSSALRSLNKLLQITEASTNDR